MDHRAAAGVTDPALRDLLERHWQATMVRHPTWASRLGDRRFENRLAGTYPSDHREAEEENARFLAEAVALDRSVLSHPDAFTLDLFREDLAISQKMLECRFAEWGVHPRNTPFSKLGWLSQIRPFDSVGDAAGLLDRYRAWPETIRGEIECLRVGADQGLHANRESLQRTVLQLNGELDKPTARWAAVSGIGFAGGVAAEDAAAFRGRAREVLDAEVVPALREYVEFIERDLLPHGREGDEVGLGSLPGGDELYGVQIAKYTTMPLSAEAIHEQGLAEMRKIHGEFAALGETVLGTSVVANIFERLRSDPELHFRTAEEVEEKAVRALESARAAIPSWFGRLPATDCVVRRIPDHEAPYTTIAYYRPPSGDGTQPGEYRINVHAPETRPRFEAEALAFHESIPGHHLQIASAMELPEMPAFRRLGHVTAYVEGWALYTERLADEMGLYSSDLDRLGMLSFDAWRASRLVVDTGIHAFGWSREKAIEYMAGNTPLALNNIDNEVDRYITWPGQALAYKTGQVAMGAARRGAEATLLDRFDVKRFHDQVLGLGPVPLTILATEVGRWAAGLNAE